MASMTAQPAQRAVTTMASPMIVGKDEPFLVKLTFVVVALVIGLACFVALVALLSAVLPKTARRCEVAAARWPVQSLVAGLLVHALALPLAWFLLSRGYVPRLLRVEIVPSMLGLGLLVVTVVLLGTFVGATGLVRLIGVRLADAPGAPATPLRHVVVGTFVAVLSSGFPLVGWAVTLPALLMVSMGALLVGALRWRQIDGRP
jgi:hypothetical protein